MALLNYDPPVNPYLDILYRDEDIVVLNKPSGLLSVPGKAIEHRDSLQSRVTTVFPNAGVVHRLDMATSGLMLMAMNKPAHRELSAQFRDRETQKTYHAILLGQLPEDEGSVDLPLICDWPNRPKQMVDMENGKPSLTYYKVLDKNQTTTFVELTPVTGRSHQLRVHMLSLGHPIIGDKLYSGEAGKALSDRLCLHASTLQFRHPTSQQWMSFEAPISFDLKAQGFSR